MTDPMLLRRNVPSALLPAATAALAAGIFAAEAMTSLKLTAAIFYVFVVLLSARFCSARGIVLVGAGCVGLTMLAFFLPGFTETEAGGVGVKASVSAAVVGLTTFLVTERQRVTEALQESEGQWREVFEHNPVMYFMVDATGTILSVNGFGAAQLGYTAVELIGRSVMTVFFEGDRDVVKDQLAICVEEFGRSHSWEIQKIRKDGTVLWVRENAKAVRRSANDVIILIAGEDITERRRGERRVAAQFAVTRVLAEADSYAGSAPQVLQAIGENLEWDWGSLWSFDWERDRDAAPLRCDILWHAPDIESTELDIVSREWVFAADEGLVGQVWRTARAVWMVDATTQPGFLRASAAAKAGLHGAVIFPIMLDTEPLGVVEFFSRAPRERDEDQLVTLSAIGSQLGQFIKRRRAEAALRVNEERWRRLFETSAAGMALEGLDGMFTAANPALQRMLGRTAGEIVGHNVLELNHEDERAATAEALAKFRSGSLTERQVEKKYLKKDGGLVWLNITTTFVPATEIASPFLQVVYIDITERVRAEAALRASEERWRAIFDSAAVGIAAGDLRGGLFNVNPTFQRMLGYTEEELRNLRSFEFTHEDDRAETRRLFSRVVTGQQPSYRLEKRYRRKDGAIVWADVTASSVPATENTPAFLAVMAVDITDRKQAETALRASDERWRAIFESSAVGIAMGDLKGGVLGMNPTFQRMLGYADDEIRNLTVFEFTHEDDQAETRRLFGGLVTGPRRGYRLEKRYRRKDGGTVWADVSASLVPATDDTPAFLAVMAVDITDRKRTEAALRASEERWRTVFETTAIGIATSDLNLRYATANQSFQRMTGYTGDELRNLSSVDITHEEDRAATRKAVDDIVAGPRRSYRIEKRYRRKDGQIVWADVNVSFLPRMDGTPAFFALMTVDITDRKRAEAALRASEERWRAMFETAPVGIAMLDFEHRRYLAANAAFQRMTGYTEDELRQLTALDITHEDDRAAAQQRVDDGIIGVLQPKRYRRKDGGVIWADVTAFVVPATDNTPAFLGAVIVDITDRKRAEDALRRSEALLSEVFATLPDGVAVVGRDYRYQRVNRGYELRTGLTADQITERHVADLVDPEAFNETVKPGLDRCFAGAHVTYARWFSQKDSEKRYFEVTYSPLFLAGPGRPNAILVLTRDLTEFMQASEALQQAQADLARLNRVMLLDEMAASIAHEVNQPIAAVITNASAGLRWLGAPQPDLDEVRHALGRIVRDGTRAGEVIGRIRALVRKMPPRRDLLDINEAIREVIALTQTEMQRSGVRLQSRLADDLPLVSADRVQLQQIMMNLVVNAIEAMASASNRSRELTVVSGTDNGNDVFVEVQDTGPGLDPEKLDRLFQSFYTTKPDGIGMGLAISRSIAEAHGGRLSAAPNQPRGAVFRFTLPVEEQSSEGAPDHRVAGRY
jgi:PAS domain S-box-containing protein